MHPRANVVPERLPKSHASRTLRFSCCNSPKHTGVHVKSSYMQLHLSSCMRDVSLITRHLQHREAWRPTKEFDESVTGLIYVITSFPTVFGRNHIDHKLSSRNRVAHRWLHLVFPRDFLHLPVYNHYSFSSHLALNLEHKFLSRPPHLQKR